jgi:ATP phosphoribosyltransferase
MAAEGMPLIHLALPKGHMKESVFKLMNEAGMKIKLGNDRAYRPTLSVPGYDVKLLKVLLPALV